MRQNLGTEKDTAYGGEGRRPVDLVSILPPATLERAGREPDMGAGTIGLEIDDVAVRVPAGSTIFQAAEAAGYTPPHFCYHRDLSIPANCRMCLCEVEGQAKLQTSCSIAAADSGHWPACFSRIVLPMIRFGPAKRATW